MRKNLRLVRPEDFDVELLMAAAREGRLYVDESKKTVSKEEVKRDVRAYVARIKVFVCKNYKSSIDVLWEQILNSDELTTFLTPGSKAKKCRAFDKYGVMRIIGVLRENGVYESYNDRKYDALLEPDVKDSPYRKYLSKGIEQRYLLLLLKKIIASNKH